MRLNQNAPLAPLKWHGTGLRNSGGRFPVAVSTPLATPIAVGDLSGSPRRSSGPRASSSRGFKPPPNRQSASGAVSLTGPPLHALYSGGPTCGEAAHSGQPERPSTRDAICNGLRRQQVASSIATEDLRQVHAPEQGIIVPGRSHSQLQRHAGVLGSGTARPGTADIEPELMPVNASSSTPSAADDKGLGPHAPWRPRSRKPRHLESPRLDLGDLHNMEIRQPIPAPADDWMQRPTTRGKPLACFLDDSALPDVPPQALAPAVGSTAERLQQDSCVVESATVVTDATPRLKHPGPPRAATAGRTSQQGIGHDIARPEDPSNRRRGSTGSSRGNSERGGRASGRERDKHWSAEEESSPFLSVDESTPASASSQTPATSKEASGFSTSLTPMPAPGTSTLSGGGLPISTPRPLSTCGGILLEDIDDSEGVSIDMLATLDTDVGEGSISNSILMSSIPQLTNRSYLGAPRSNAESRMPEEPLEVNDIGAINVVARVGGEADAHAPSMPKPGTSSGRRYRKQAAGEVRKIMMTKVDIERDFGASRAVAPMPSAPKENNTSRDGQSGSRRRLLQSSLGQDFLNLFARH